MYQCASDAGGAMLLCSGFKLKLGWFRLHTEACVTNFYSMGGGWGVGGWRPLRPMAQAPPAAGRGWGRRAGGKKRKKKERRAESGAAGKTHRTQPKAILTMESSKGTCSWFQLLSFVLVFWPLYPCNIHLPQPPLPA